MTKLNPLSPEGLAALAGSLLLEEDFGNGDLAPGVYEKAQAEAARYGYDAKVMEIAYDWFGSRNNSWDETTAFLKDPACLEWLARLMAGGWDNYDVNAHPSEEMYRHAMRDLVARRAAAKAEESNAPAIINITDANPDAVRGPAGSITKGCFTFDAMGNRYEVTRVVKRKRNIAIHHFKSDEPSVIWALDEEVTYVPLKGA